MRSELFSTWIGVLLLAGGALGTAAALVLVLGDARSELAINVLFRIAAGLVTVGVLAAGWVLYRDTADERAVTEAAAAHR